MTNRTRQSNRTLANFCLILGLSHCATAQKSPPQKTQKNSIAKSTQRDAKAQKKIVAEMAQPNPLEDLVHWTSKMISQETVFAMRDKQYAASLASSPKSGSIQEAAMTVGILRDIVTPPGGNSDSFSTVDKLRLNETGVADTNVVPREQPSFDSKNVLEVRCREKGLDIVQALATNPFLKNASIYTWVWNASLMEGNTDLFKQNIATVVRSEAMLWQEIARKSGMQDGVTPPAQEVPVAITPPTGAPTTNSTDPATLGVAPPALTATGQIPPVGSVPAPAGEPGAPNSLSDAEATQLFATAQEAAVAENFEKAVAEISKVPPSSSKYEIAQENMRQWSNRAVTELRKKAAFEYRSASNVTDVPAKKVALNKAKTLLDDSLKKYPAASNLDTVRDNLKMIEGELERLK